MPEITNRATLSYTYGNGTVVSQVQSNVASVTLNGAITGTKTSLGETYRSGEVITYVITLQNTSTTVKTNVQVSDNLGTYIVGGTTVTPLDYVGPTEFFVNGTPNGELVPTVTASNVVFTIPVIPAGGNVVLVYRASINEFAPLESGSTITNTASYIGTEACNDFTVDNTITVENYADVRITKAMSPDPIVCGSPITYTFTLYNYGNTEATNVTLTDVFSPAPASITVTLDGTVVTPDGYTYENGVLTIPSGTAQLTLPSATTTVEEDGSVTINPSISTITVTGIITNS